MQCHTDKNDGFLERIDSLTVRGNSVGWLPLSSLISCVLSLSSCALSLILWISDFITMREPDLLSSLTFVVVLVLDW